MIETIGNTPVVRLKRIVPLDAAEVWVKIEGVNPTGSYKDRMALAMVEGAVGLNHRFGYSTSLQPVGKVCQPAR